MSTTIQSWVVYYVGLRQPVSVKIVKAKSAEDAKQKLQSRLKSGQTAIKAELFTSSEDIKIWTEKRNAVQAEILMKHKQRFVTAEAAKLRIQNDAKTWPGGFIPRCPLTYIMSVLYSTL